MKCRIASQPIIVTWQAGGFAVPVRGIFSESPKQKAAIPWGIAAF
ncbi:hypothetical protein [Cupriavidus necator]|nr:hypothetical protein [Cupriavidus necator]